ncbi:MAG: response regulator [Natronospirillum sp.]
MSQTFGVLIIEDDFRVAEINRQFIEQSPGFQVVGVVKSKAETEAFMAQHSARIDLVLLDAYIPDVNGLELLWSLRRDHKHLDIIMITAAKEVETIQEALRGGVFDYLIKPTESTRMAQTLERFAAERALLQSHQELNQDELDAALSRGGPLAANIVDRLPKGIDKLTLDNVTRALHEAAESVTAVTLARQIGTSRSTARRYLEYLVAQGSVTAELDYGEVGRPERRYRL